MGRKGFFLNKLKNSWDPGKNYGKSIFFNLSLKHRSAKFQLNSITNLGALRNVTHIYQQLEFTNILFFLIQFFSGSLGANLDSASLLWKTINSFLVFKPIFLKLSFFPYFTKYIVLKHCTFKSTRVINTDRTTLYNDVLSKVRVFKKPLNL